MKEAKKEKANEATQVVNANEQAVGIWYDESKQHWNLVTIHFDPLLKIATQVILDDVGPSKDEVVSRFKIFTGRNFL